MRDSSGGSQACTSQVLPRLDLSPIEGELASIEGQPYAEVNVGSDRNRILDYYFSNGFPSATFRYAATPDAETKTVRLNYEVHEGPREFVRPDNHFRSIPNPTFSHSE